MTTITELGLIERMDPVLFRAPKDLIIELGDLSKKTQVTKSELIRQGIKKILEVYNV